MKTAIHVFLIVAVGVALGLTVRAVRQGTASGDGPEPDDVVYTNDPDVQPDEEVPIENPEPTILPDGYELMSEFELTERSGETVSSEQLRGQPYIVSFFFTTCPSICIQQNQKMKELQEEFEGEPVRLLAITCDPENDTPEQLREYAARFGADEDQWLFLTGELDYIRRMGAEVFQIAVDEKFHAEKFILVDPDGKVEGYYSWPEPRQFEKLQERIGEMIAEVKAS